MKAFRTSAGILLCLAGVCASDSASAQASARSDDFVVRVETLAAARDTECGPPESRQRHPHTRALVRRASPGDARSESLPNVSRAWSGRRHPGSVSSWASRRRNPCATGM